MAAEAVSRPQRVALGFLFVVFALGSWLGINSIFSELQVLMFQLPEGLALASQVSLAVQCSNVFLLLYLLFPLFCPAVLRKREELSVLVVLGVAAGGLVLLSVFWNMTADIGGSPHSLALLLLTVLIGGANICSSPVFFPLMTQYPPGFTSAFACGEASTSLVASIVAVIQDATGMSVAAYFGVMAGLVVLSGVAYCVLRFNRAAVRLRDVSVRADAEAVPLVTNEAPLSLRSVRVAAFRVIWLDLLVTVVLNVVESGALVAILSYLATPYGPSFFKAALWGGMAAAPVGTMMTLAACVGQAWHWALLWVPLSVFLIVNSVANVLVSSVAFGSFVVACVIVARLAIGYTKALVYIRVQERTNSEAMLLVAVAQQMGAAVGSLVFFLLVNYSDLYA
jgi:hypothetical protein